MSEQKPKWLPDIVSVNGEWNAVVAMLYRIFDRDFTQTGCCFDKLPVWWDRRKLDGSPYEEAFWHLITRFDYGQQSRLLDSRRAERLPWCKPTIEHFYEPQIKVWDYREGKGQIRTYVWLENWDYVVILEKRQIKNGQDVAFLITAFHVSGKQTRKGLQRKYEQKL